MLLMWDDYSKYIRSNEVHCITDEAQLIYNPDFDPLEMPSRFLNLIVRNSRVLFSHKEKDALIGVFKDCCFFTVSSGYPVSCVDGDVERKTAVNCLKSVYVMKGRRNQGVQNELLKYITLMSTLAGEAVIAFVKPFELPLMAKDDDLKSCLKSFLAGGDLRYSADEERKQKQRDRLERAGFENMPWQYAQITQPADHYIQVPETLEDERTKEIMDCRRRSGQDTTSD